jgi:hypothetical protein
MQAFELIQFVVLFSFIGAGSDAVPIQLPGYEPFETIARVNGDVITRSEYEEAGRLLDTMLRINFTGSELREAIAKENRDLLRTLIDDRLLLQRANALNIWPDNEAIKYLDGWRRQYKLPNMEALEEWIIREGIDREELISHLKSQSLRNQVFRREVFWEVEGSISDEEIQKYYESHQQNFGKNEGGFHSLEDVRNEIHDRIFDARAQRAIQEYLVRLRKGSVIEVKPGYVDTGATR